jgi:cobalt-zinc-cadmium efflux system protein
MTQRGPRMRGGPDGGGRAEDHGSGAPGAGHGGAPGHAAPGRPAPTPGARPDARRGDHGHDHGPHAHGAAVSEQTDRRMLTGALALILGYMAVEVGFGITAHSLALISDAGHMLTDAASLVLALVAMRLAARPAVGRWTYGFKRAEILSAQANGITLLLLVGLFVYEAVRRLISPPPVLGGVVVAVALAGIAVNATAAWLLSRANRTSLNIEGAFQHILNDAWAFIATAAAGLVILATGFARADALASLVVAALMGRAGYALVRDSWRIFLEAAPEGLDPARVGSRLAADEEVAQVHDLHIWTITSGFPALSAHVLVVPGRDCHAVRGRLEGLLHTEFDIGHTTLQVEHASVTILNIEPNPALTEPGRGGAPGAGKPDPDGGHCG